MTEVLTKAIILATGAHAGQTDKSGVPYILHPLRVMARLAAKGRHETVLAAAVLHDVLEDTPVTIAELVQNFPVSVWSVVATLTRIKGESYRSYLKRVKRHPVAREIKIEDATDNLNRCVTLPVEIRTEYTRKYANALIFLEREDV